LRQYADEYRNEMSAQYSYGTTWDADIITGCVCDFMYDGYDCRDARYANSNPNPNVNPNPN